MRPDGLPGTKRTTLQAGRPAATPLSQGEPRGLGAEVFAVAAAAECGELFNAEHYAELFLIAGLLDDPALLFDAWNALRYLATAWHHHPDYRLYFEPQTPATPAAWSAGAVLEEQWPDGAAGIPSSAGC